MPADFFAVTSVGIAHILRRWALQEGFYIYIYLTSIYHVGSECEHTFQRVKYKVITFPLLSLFCWKNEV